MWERSHSPGSESSRVCGGWHLGPGPELREGGSTRPLPGNSGHSAGPREGLGCRLGPLPGHHWKESIAFTRGSRSWLLVFVCSGVKDEGPGLSGHVSPLLP